MHVASWIPGWIKDRIGWWERPAFRFDEVAVEKFSFLLDEFGFRVRLANEVTVEFESPACLVRVFHGHHSYRVGAEFELKSASQLGKFDLYEVVEAKGMTWETAALVQRPRELPGALARLAEGVRLHALDVVQGNPTIAPAIIEARHEYTKRVGQQQSNH